MPQFDISTYPSQIFWLVIVFSCMYLVILKFIVPASEKIFAARQQALDEYTDSATMIAERTKKIQENYDTGFNQILMVIKNVEQEAVLKLDKLLIEKQLILEQELAKEVALATNETKEIIESFKLTKESIIIELASSILQKIILQPSDSQLLQECYKKIK